MAPKGRSFDHFGRMNGLCASILLAAAGVASAFSPPLYRPVHIGAAVLDACMPLPRPCAERKCQLRAMGVQAKTSAADSIRGHERPRIFRPVGSNEAQDTQSNDADVRIVSYNVLGPKQALTDKHAYSHFKWRKWPYRKERIFDELRSYDADVVCLQEVTPDTFLNDFVPFMKELGLDKGIYTPKRLPDGSKSSRGPFRRPSKGRRLPPELFGTGPAPSVCPPRTRVAPARFSPMTPLTLAPELRRLMNPLKRAPAQRAARVPAIVACSSSCEPCLRAGTHMCLGTATFIRSSKLALLGRFFGFLAVLCGLPTTCLRERVSASVCLRICAP